MKFRRWGIVVLVLSTVMMARPPAATAFAGTGTISVDGWYYYEHFWATCCFGHAYLYIDSQLCTDTWAGTTTNESVVLGLCTMWLGGYDSPAPPTTTAPSMYVSGSYQSDFGGTPHTFRFVLPRPEPSVLAPPVLSPPGPFMPSWNAGITTGAVTSGPYQGPATMTYHLLPPSISVGCAPYCYPDYYYYEAWGQITFTVDYVLH